MPSPERIAAARILLSERASSDPNRQPEPPPKPRGPEALQENPLRYAAMKRMGRKLAASRRG